MKKKLIKPILRQARQLCLLLGLLAVLFPSSRTVLAHGGGELQIANAPIADYQVSVWTNPPTARAGQPIHVTVGIAWAESGEPMLDATVLVTVRDASGQPATTAAATTEQSVNRLFYEADLSGVPAGAYELTVAVTGAAGNGVVSFPLPVEPVPVWPWAVGLLAVMGVGWVLSVWRKKQKVAVPVRRTAVPRSRSVD